MIRQVVEGLAVVAVFVAACAASVALGLPDLAAVAVGLVAVFVVGVLGFPPTRR